MDLLLSGTGNSFGREQGSENFSLCKHEEVHRKCEAFMELQDEEDFTEPGQKPGLCSEKERRFLTSPLSATAARRPRPAQPGAAPRSPRWVETPARSRSRSGFESGSAWKPSPGVFRAAASRAVS
ncbi:hypothetical protein FQA47_024490 [Oryzias melastigma]|uniref:Uncharacterized protein n=1 Tax=Oryzias melastigma TaxID=30732 RepID=A0A834BJX3_ORYME|nr:hypothetical protein FQA47_024490 [Oryzias melastigma]